VTTSSLLEIQEETLRITDCAFKILNGRRMDLNGVATSTEPYCYETRYYEI